MMTTPSFSILLFASCLLLIRLPLSTTAFSTNNRNQQDFIIIGAGPVGAQAALLLSQNGYTVTVYDKLAAFQNNLVDTYPIGVNRRGLQSLQLTDTAKAVEDSGILVDSWQIFLGKRRVAVQPSGNVYGQTRGQVNSILLQQAEKDPNITIKWNHGLKSIDFETKTLTFEQQGSSSTDTVVVDASQQRMLAAGGVRSVTRAEMERAFSDKNSLLAAEYGFNDSGFQSKETPWGVRFRVLFSSEPDSDFTLDPNVHYIFSGIYAAVINPGDSGPNRWSIVLSITDSDPDRDLLLSKDSSDENVAKLREYLERQAPPLIPLFSDEDAKAFFTRRTFHGTLVEVNRLNAGEWLCLLGDAAHGVIPPTGEGINSGLEDCEVLIKCLNDDGSIPSDWFSRYNQARLDDVLCLQEIASFLNEDFSANKAEKAARLLTRLFSALRRAIGLGRPSYEELTYGKLSNPSVSYQEAAKAFRGNNFGLGTMRRLVRPFAGTASVSKPGERK